MRSGRNFSLSSSYPFANHLCWALGNLIYDGVNPVQETSGATVLANVLPGLGTDEYFTRTDVVAGTTSNLLTDALGSTVALADSAGTVQTEYIYEPFGKTTATGTSTTNSLQYTGRENDSTGLYFYRARYYHPSLQRFIGEDPLRASLNLYSHVGNNSLIATDPFGLFTVVVRGGFGTGPVGVSGTGGSLQEVTTLLGDTGEAVIQVGPGDAAAAIGLLRAHQGDPSGANVACHSRGCDQFLSQFSQTPDVRVDTLVTLDCFGFSGSCGTIPDNVGANLNFFQSGFLGGGPNQRAGGGTAGITNIQVSSSHTGIPGDRGVQNAIVGSILAGQSGSRGGGMGGRK